MDNIRPLRGIALMLCAIVFFAMLDASAKWLSSRYPVPMLVWARYSVHCLLMLLFLLPSRGKRLWQTARPLLLILRALMLLGVTSSIFMAFQRLPLTTATALYYSTPLLVALLAPVLLRERPSARLVIAILVGVTGMLFVARPDSEANLLGIAFALCGALFNTAYQLLTRHLAPSEDSVTLLFYTAATGCIATSLLLPWWGSAIHPSLHDALLILLLGILGGCGHYLLIRAFRHATATLLAPFFYVQLIWAALLDLLLFTHLPDAWSWAGIALIAAAGLYIVSTERTKT